MPPAANQHHLSFSHNGLSNSKIIARFAVVENIPLYSFGDYLQTNNISESVNCFIPSRKFRQNFDSEDEAVLDAHACRLSASRFAGLRYPIRRGSGLFILNQAFGDASEMISGASFHVFPFLNTLKERQQFRRLPLCTSENASEKY